MMNLIFDYDGTLHDCARIYIPAFRKGYKYLTDSGLMEYRYYSDEEISDYLGYSPKDMWNRFNKDLDESEKIKCGNMISDLMLNDIRSGRAKLYDGAEETLDTLVKSGYSLIFLSNCAHDYMQAHIETMKLDRFFSGFYCTGDFDMKPKYEIFESIKQDFDGGFAAVGDRFHDLELAKRHGLKSIGCAYGYGSRKELEPADIIVDSVRDIPEAVNRLNLCV